MQHSTPASQIIQSWLLGRMSRSDVIRWATDRARAQSHQPITDALYELACLNSSDEVDLARVPDRLAMLAGRDVPRFKEEELNELAGKR